MYVFFMLLPFLLVHTAFNLLSSGFFFVVVVFFFFKEEQSE